MIEHVRPYQALHLFQTVSYYERLVKLVLPDSRSPMTLETMVLLALEKCVQPRTIFEFGTFLGINTLNLATNMRDDGVIYTLDLDESSFSKASQHPVDRKL